MIDFLTHPEQSKQCTTIKVTEQVYPVLTHMTHVLDNHVQHQIAINELLTALKLNLQYFRPCQNSCLFNLIYILFDVFQKGCVYSKKAMCRAGFPKSELVTFFSSLVLYFRYINIRAGAKWSETLKHFYSKFHSQVTNLASHSCEELHRYSKCFEYHSHQSWIVACSQPKKTL